MKSFVFPAARGAAHPAVLAVVLALMPGAAAAQSGPISQVPAEFPPASFEGVQYVDSRGCAFIRAGFGGQVNWVPRVDRDRNPVCGLPPTLAAAPRPAATPTPPPAPPAATRPAATAAAPAPVRAPAPAPVAAPVAVAPPAMPPAPAPAQAQAQARVATSQPAASARQPVTWQTPGQVQHPPVPFPAGDTTCLNYDPVAQAWTRVPAGQGVRCGPQATHPSDGRPTVGPGSTLRHAPTAHAGSLPAGRIAAPAPVAQIPPGYRAAWTDDRLNPHRAQGTALGEAQMRRVLTDTTPMREVAPSRPAATVASRGTAATVSTRGTATAPVQAAPQPQATAGGFVQVGSFGVPANAEAAAQRFRAMGLPVRTLAVRSGGRTLQIVRIGPFADGASLQRALGSARSAGFADAYVTR